MKAIVTGDWHIQGTNPRSRMDEFFPAMLRKISEVFILADKHNADVIIVPGDVLHSPGTSWGTVAELAMTLRQSPCPILTISGNHDIWGGNLSSKYRTPFGFLAKLGIIRDLETDLLELYNKATLQLTISGHGFNTDTDRLQGMNQFYAVEMATSDGIVADCFKIHVVHSMLMEKSPGFDMRHTLIHEVQTNADVIIAGHEHIGFGIKRREDGVLFINPGALCRLSAHPAEIERTVQVALLTVEGGKGEAELIPLASAQPGHIILSRDHLEAQADREDRIAKFLGLLAAEGESKFMETQEIVEDIARREAIPPEIVKEALERIGRARETLGQGVA